MITELRLTQGIFAVSSILQPFLFRTRTAKPKLPVDAGLIAGISGHASYSVELKHF